MSVKNAQMAARTDQQCILYANMLESIFAVLHLRIAATSMPGYVSGWCRHELESHSQPFLLTYSEADLSL